MNVEVKNIEAMFITKPTTFFNPECSLLTLGKAVHIIRRETDGTIVEQKHALVRHVEEGHLTVIFLDDGNLKEAVLFPKDFETGEYVIRRLD